MRNVNLLLHLLGLLLVSGGVIAQVALLRYAADEAEPAAARAIDRLAVAIATKVTLAGFFVSVVTGMVALGSGGGPAGGPSSGFAMKMAAVGVLAVTLHVDMILSRKLLRAREAGESGPRVLGLVRKAVLVRYLNAGVVLTAVFHAVAKPL